MKGRLNNLKGHKRLSSPNQPLQSLNQRLRQRSILKKPRSETPAMHTQPHLARVTDPVTMARIYRLRVDVWLQVPGVTADTFPDGQWQDGHDTHALHWAVCTGSRLVAAARLCVHDTLADLPHAEVFADLPVAVPPPIGALNRLVVHPQARAQGFAHQLDLVRLKEAQRLGCRCVVACWNLVSSERRRAALAALGFRPLEGEAPRQDTPLGPSIPLILPLDTEERPTAARATGAA